MRLSAPTGRTQAIAAAAVLVGMAVTIGIALAFQHVGGYIPCKLCLEQRTPYYLGMPLAALALVSALLAWPALATRLLLAAGGLLMAYGVWLGFFHSGVEWGWWAGPADCGVVEMPAMTGGAGVLDALDAFIPPACDVAPWRFLGLSFAGWNVVASLALAGVAFWGALARSRDQRTGETL